MAEEGLLEVRGINLKKGKNMPEVEIGDGPSGHVGSQMRRISGSDRDYRPRPSVEQASLRLAKAFEKFSPTTMTEIASLIEEIRGRVGDDPERIADLLEEGANARLETGKALRQGDMTIKEVARVIRDSKKTVN